MSFPRRHPLGDLTEEHKRRARRALARMGEPISEDDDAALQAPGC